jgi:NAD+ kinase
VSVERVGLVVHPVRDLERALATIAGWAREHGVEVVQLDAGSQERRVAARGSADACDLVLAVGGDGTVLASIRAAAAAGKPVLGVSCGSLGALATVAAPHVGEALDRFDEGAWSPFEVPALVVTPEGGDGILAFNDLVLVREGAGQITASVSVGDVLYGRIAGDGLVVSTHLGSSGYGMAAGGPVIAPGSDVFAMTPLAAHGGCVPPLVMAADALLRLDVDPGHGGARAEIDGQRAEVGAWRIDVVLRAAAATLVRLGDEEPMLSGLRRRGIVSDSPRILARDARARLAEQPVS